MNIQEIRSKIETKKLELKELEDLLKQKEEYYYPSSYEVEFSPKDCFFVLQNDIKSLDVAFPWLHTPQGFVHWANIADGDRVLEQADKDQIKIWLMNYYIVNGHF